MCASGDAENRGICDAVRKALVSVENVLSKCNNDLFLRRALFTAIRRRAANIIPQESLRWAFAIWEALPDDLSVRSSLVVYLKAA